MTLAAGTRMGRYEIRSKIGAGGMGEVYRARDEKLNRDVAIKVLPASLSQDQDRLRRFEQEAQAAGALNHPNILAVYDVGTHNGAPYIVSELLEGEELREQLNDGSLPQRKALDYAQQIAQGLAAAHERGITHRDLKPENLFVTTDGRVKILDFGLAKLSEPPAVAGGLNSEAETRRPLTDPGTVMGTVGYMSPEQVRGHEADHRSDIFSFGSILYEMLSGQRAFRRDTMAETMTAILKEDPPDITETNSKVPAQLERIVRRCLEKKPERRFHSAHDLGFALEALSMSSGSQETAAMLPSVTEGAGLSRQWLNRERSIWIAVIVLLALAATTLGWWLAARSRTAPSSALHVQIDPRPAQGFQRATLPVFTFTPDGRAIIFAGTDGTTRRLYRRQLDQAEATPIAGTEGAAGPFMSPDGAWIGFCADGALKKVPLGGGAAQTLHDLRSTTSPDVVAMGWSTEVGQASELAYGATWLAGDTIVYGRFAGGLWTIPANGGAPRSLTQTKPGEFAHRLPHALPSGEAILFTVQKLLGGRANIIEALVLKTGERRTLVEDGTDARYAPSGHLLFARQGALFAVRFDPVSLRVSGEPSRVLPDVMQAIYGSAPGRASGVAQFDISADGTLAFLPGGTISAQPNRMAWVERGGRIEPLDVEPMHYLFPKISPDGKRVAVTGQRSTEETTLYIIDLARGVSAPVMKGAHFALWAPDGSRLVAATAKAVGQEQGQGIYSIPVTGSGQPERLVASQFLLWPGSISGDGRWLAYVESNPVTGNDIWVAGLNPVVAPQPIIQTPAIESYPVFSADGRWLAYNIVENGTPEVYVQPFPGPGRRERVTKGGGYSPLWAPDGRSLFYMSPDRRKIFVVSISVGDPIHVEQSEVFAEGDFSGTTPVTGYDVSKDGRRLLVTLRMPEDAASRSGGSAASPLQLQMILNAQSMLPK
jgi:eukaryotic-like serine/threonine-protein kinase